MYRFHGVRKVGQTLQRETHTFRLGASLMELFELYDQLGGATTGAVSAIETRIERCLSDPRRTKPQVQGHLYVLLRAKDIHTFLLEDAALTALKVQMLEFVLVHRNLEERWAAIRELLLASIQEVCGVGGAGGTALYEAFKRQASLRVSRLGKLLQAVALFNFDIDEEQPPANLCLRFARGAFPGHCWEPCGDGSISIAQGPEREWSPANPLCRWEFLAADLGHALFRSHQAGSAAGRRAGAGFANGEHGAAGFGAEIGAGYGAESGGNGTLYRAIAANGAADGAGDQMELFPLDCRTFMAQLSREVHTAFAAEGTRLFALLLERLSWGGVGEVLEVSLADLAAEPPGSGTSPKAIRERAHKLFAIVERLGQVRLIRIATDGVQSGAHAATFLTLLGERTDLPHGSGPRPLADRVAARASEPPRSVRLVVDPCFFRGAEGNLGLPYRELPEGLLCVPARRHPYAVGLYVFTRHLWQAEWTAAQGVILRPARQLLHEAGYGLKENARYRAIEALKRDLNFLQEQGWLGKWRINRAAARDILDDVYRLESPMRGAQADVRISPSPSEALVSA